MTSFQAEHCVWAPLKTDAGIPVLLQRPMKTTDRERKTEERGKAKACTRFQRTSNGRRASRMLSYCQDKEVNVPCIYGAGLFHVATLMGLVC